MARKVGQGEEEEVAQSQEAKREDASLPWREEDVGVTEDENLWIASRMVWFDQPRPPDSSQTDPVKIEPSS
ncbi:hypothetical protein STEG23_032883 [Scotinomys teguina]